MQEVRLAKNFSGLIDPADCVGKEYLSGNFYTPDSNQIYISSTLQINTSSLYYETSQQTIDKRCYAMHSLRAFVDIPSLTPIQQAEYELTDLEEQRYVKDLNERSKAGKIYLEIQLVDAVRRLTVGRVWLQNRRPGYYINLMRYLSDKPTFIASNTTSIGWYLIDAGNGLLQSNDLVSFWGEIEEVGYVIKAPQIYT